MKKTRNGMRITGLLLTMVMLVALLGAFSLTARAAAAEDISVTIDTGASITLKDTDGDGVRELDGQPIKLEWITYENRGLADMAQAGQQQL